MYAGRRFQLPLARGNPKPVPIPEPPSGGRFFLVLQVRICLLSLAAAFSDDVNDNGGSANQTSHPKQVEQRRSRNQNGKRANSASKMTPPEEQQSNLAAKATGSFQVVLGAQRGWRVGHQGRDEMFYEEWHEGSWRRIRISGELLTGHAHHAIYFEPPERWLNYPDWARHRREEIIARIKSEFRPPDYEYHGEVLSAPSENAANQASVTPRRATAKPTRPVKMPGRQTEANFTPAVLLVVVLLLGISTAMGWLVGTGLSRGETYFPSKISSHRRSVSRQQEPVTYWISVGIYAGVGLGALGLAGWILRESLRPAFKGSR